MIRLTRKTLLEIKFENQVYVNFNKAVWNGLCGYTEKRFQHIAKQTPLDGIHKMESLFKSI